MSRAKFVVSFLFLSLFFSQSVCEGMPGQCGLSVTFQAAMPLRRSKTGLQEQITEAYRGILEDTLSQGLLNGEDIERLARSRGMTVMTSNSQSLLLPTQQAIDSVCETGKRRGLSEKELEGIFVGVLEAKFGTAGPVVPSKLEKRAVSSRAVSFSLLKSPRFFFPKGLDEAYAGTSDGKIYRLPLVPGKHADKWELIFTAENYRDNEPISFDLDLSGEKLAVYDGQHLLLQDLKADKLLWKQAGLKKRKILFSPNGRMLATIADGEPFQLLNLQNFSLTQHRFWIDKTPQPFGHNTNMKITTSESRWQKNLLADLRFTLGNHLLITDVNGWTHNLWLKKVAEVTPIWGWDVGSTIWGIFKDDRLFYTQNSGALRLLELSEGGGWNPFKGSAFRVNSVVADERRQYLYLTAENTIFPMYVSEDWHEPTELNSIVGTNGKDHIAQIFLSPNGCLLAVQSKRALYLWNVKDPANAIFLKRLDHVFAPADPKGARAGFSGSGRFFSGLRSDGKFIVVDLTEFYGGQR